MFIEWRNDLALTCLMLGESDEASRVAAEDLELSRAFGAPREEGMALRNVGLIEGETGLEHLRRSVEVLELSEAQLELARSRAELGAGLRRAGLRNEAREQLRRALDLATKLNASLIAGRAHEELVTAGARPRRARLTGLDALTASELRVARLAAAGHTNPRIAQSLFVTRRTVEVHLTSVYSKLEISSREQLPAALESG